jgi:hypothetical protein
MLGRQRKNGHVQMDMSKALHAVPRNYFYVLKVRLPGWRSCQQLHVHQERHSAPPSAAWQPLFPGVWLFKQQETLCAPYQLSRSDSCIF